MQTAVYSPKKELAKIEEIVRKFNWEVEYDGDHRFKGVRNAEQVWKDKKGHCIEQAALFFPILNMFNIKTKFLVVKNPKGFERINLDDVAVHPFLIYQSRK